MPDAINSRKSEVNTATSLDAGTRWLVAIMCELHSWFRSSSGVLSGLPANTGRTWTVSSDQGELGDEWAIVWCMLVGACDKGSPEVASFVPSGKTRIPAPGLDEVRVRGIGGCMLLRLRLDAP